MSFLFSENLFIIVLVEFAGAFTENDDFPLLDLICSYGRCNLDSAVSIFAIIGTEVPLWPVQSAHSQHQDCQLL